VKDVRPVELNMYDADELVPILGTDIEEKYKDGKRVFPQEDDIPLRRHVPRPIAPPEKRANEKLFASLLQQLTGVVGHIRAVQIEVYVRTTLLQYEIPGDVPSSTIQGHALRRGGEGWRTDALEGLRLLAAYPFVAAGVDRILAQHGCPPLLWEIRLQAKTMWRVGRRKAWRCDIREKNGCRCQHAKTQ
jgi:hypothetical protein